ncbi:RNA helicase [Klebsiella pneumoniae]|uniref:RNA helicase n=1 Tax=Klebsiella pneumoniae TaxID=573 RepID=UPI0011C010EC|nr:RNA helicase [Klebsiella pneumoniae]QEA09499.1 hypothetical protein [Klebsiella phage ST13-OXA48phi12.5]HBX5531487.1 RNA helicase [Klebsiella pneumoniae]
MDKVAHENKNTDEQVEAQDQRPVCGIIMPIADTDGYPKGHWQHVYAILSEAANAAGFKPNLVSFDSDVGVIQKRIVQNIYSNPIVICDISSRNPNVMLELGMRLAFDKPVIIVKDIKTDISFDISPIEHLRYPDDLRYKIINEFKSTLSYKLVETHKKSIRNPDYTTFLKHYGTFEIVKIQQKEVSEARYILSELEEIKKIIRQKDYKSEPHSRLSSVMDYGTFIYPLNDANRHKIENLTWLKTLEKDSDFTITSLEIKDDTLVLVVTSNLDEGPKNYDIILGALNEK